MSQGTSHGTTRRLATPRARPARGARGWDLLAAVFIGAALWAGLHATAGVDRPPDLDHLRDIAQAQAALDGHPLSDPFYAGEWIWYNPLVPWIVAAGARVTSLPAAVFHVRGGPWLNLAGAILFYLLAARLAGRPAGVLALVFFLFWPPARQPPWAWATYTPWLFTGAFAQALFYACALSAGALIERPGARTAALAGILAGAAFLAHTAPFVLGCAVLGTAFARLVAKGRARPWHVALAAGLALAVASPFLWSIGGHYQFAVRNATPLAWEFEPLTIAGLPQLLRAQNWTLAALAVAGLVYLGRKEVARPILWPWLAAALGLTAYGVARSAHPSWPALVPTFHFWFSLTALESLLAGAGAWAILERAVAVRRQWAAGLAAAAAIGLFAVRLPAYLARPDFHELRRQALARGTEEGRAASLLRRFGRPGETVLARDAPGLEIAAPAGFRVVSVDRFFSNPYVAYEPRTAARDGMLASLRAGDGPGFTAAARRYGVSKVLGMGDECRGFGEAPMLRPVVASGRACIFEIEAAGR